MKSKTLIGLAVASTFAWSAGALAHSSYELTTPLSVNESGPVLLSHQQSFSHEPSSSFATSSAEHSILGSPLADSSDWTGSIEQVAMSDEGMSHHVAMSDEGMLDHVAMSDEGMSDHVAMSDEGMSDQIAMSDEGMSSPPDQLALADEELDYSYLIFPSSDEQLAWWSIGESGDELAMSEPMSFGDEQLALSEWGDEYAQIGDSEFVPLSATQEDLVAWVLETSPVDDTANVG